MRPDIPPDLLTRAKSIDPSLATWLETAYPTDAEQAARVRRRRGQRNQLSLPHTNRRI